MDNRKVSRTTRWPSQTMSMATLIILTMLLAACFPPKEPVAPSTVPANESTASATEGAAATPATFAWTATKMAGVALAMQAPIGTQVLLTPAHEVRVALTFQDFREALRNNKVPGISPAASGCVMMALLAVNGNDEPADLVYTDLLAGQIISPISWSDIGVYTTTLSVETAYVAGAPLAIASATMLAASESCDDPLDDSLERLFQETDGLAQVAQRLLLAVPDSGAFQTYLVIIEPGAPSGCQWVLSQCSGCKNCGYEVVCAVAKFVCK